MSSIPASQIVAVTPSVLAPAGLGLALNGLILTENTRVPIGEMMQFATAADVSAFFGPSSEEFTLAQTYFAGYDNSSIKPGLIYFAQYNASPAAAYLWGGKFSSLTIAEVNAIPTGSLTVVVDGYTHSAASINLSGATSYSNAATIINSALNASQPQQAAFTATIAGTSMTVSAVASGTLAVGQTVTGTSVTANSIITAQVSGTDGGIGVYTLSESSTVGSGESMTTEATAPIVSFDSVTGSLIITSGITGVPSTIAFATGTIAASLFLTQQTGAYLSQGAIAATPSSEMTTLSQQNQNWATFMTVFDPDNGSGNSVKLQFAEWTSQQNQRWNYVCWDTDASPTTQVPASTSLGQLLKNGNYSGTTLIYRTASLGDANNIAAFYCGMAASINFAQRNGRITTAFKGQAGLTPDITNATVAANLIANGYNFYAQYATATDQFNWFYPGQVSGNFNWCDAYLNQIWLNTSFQEDLMTLLGSIGAVPYNTQGYNLIQAAVMSTIQAGLNFGAFSPGVQLSPLQIAEIINAAGSDITNTLFSQGWYFQVQPATAEIRAARASPVCNFWYTDAGAVQKIQLNSIAVE